MITIRDPKISVHSKLALLMDELYPEFTTFDVPSMNYIKSVTGENPLFVSRDKITFIDNDSHEDLHHDMNKSSIFMRAAHHAYASHIPFGIEPEVIWYLIMHEVAIHVHLNKNEYSHIFTDKPGEKQRVVVLNDSFASETPNWQRILPVFKMALANKVPVKTLQDMLPKFSTLTDESNVALLVAFMDVASDYFEYVGSTRCGIPEFRMGGTTTDWELISTKANILAKKFPTLEQYFTILNNVLSKLTEASTGVQDLDFWRSFYKWEDESGGPTVTGWINAFFAHETNDPKGYYSRNKKDAYVPIRRREADIFALRGNSTHYPAHISSVEMLWERNNVLYKKVNLITGVLGSEFIGRFLTPQLGYAVCGI